MSDEWKGGLLSGLVPNWGREKASRTLLASLGKRWAESVLLFDGDDEFRQTCIDSFRRWTTRWLEQSERLGDIGIEQAAVARYLWKAEALEDPVLASRLECALPHGVRVELANRGQVRARPPRPGWTSSA